MKNKEQIQKLLKMSDSELNNELKKAQIDAQNTRLEIDSKKNSKVSQAKNKRRYVAKILTILSTRNGEQDE